MQMHTHYRMLVDLDLSCLRPLERRGSIAADKLTFFHGSRPSVAEGDGPFHLTNTTLLFSEGRDQGSHAILKGKAQDYVLKIYRDGSILLARRLSQGLCQVAPWPFVIDEARTLRAAPRLATLHPYPPMIHLTYIEDDQTKKASINLFPGLCTVERHLQPNKSKLETLRDQILARITDDAQRIFDAVKTAAPLYRPGHDQGALLKGEYAYPSYQEQLEPFPFQDTAFNLLNGLPGYLFARMPNIKWAYFEIQSGTMTNDGQITWPSVSLRGSYQDTSKFIIAKEDLDGLMQQIENMLSHPEGPIRISQLISEQKGKPHTLYSRGISYPFKKLSSHDIMEHNRDLRAKLAPYQPNN